MNKCNMNDGKAIFTKTSSCNKTEQTTTTNGTSLLLLRVANVLTTEKDSSNKIKKLLEVLR